MVRRPKKLTAEWVKTKVLTEKYNFTDRHLSNLRANRTLKADYHWIDISAEKAKRPTYRYHLQRCEQVFEATGGDRHE